MFKTQFKQALSFMFGANGEKLLPGFSWESVVVSFTASVLTSAAHSCQNHWKKLPLLLFDGTCCIFNGDKSDELS